MNYDISIMLREFDGSFEKAIAYCSRQVWMAGLNGNNKMLDEYTRFRNELLAEQEKRIDDMMNRQQSAITGAAGMLASKP